jgi:hypothetical protein
MQGEKAGQTKTRTFNTLRDVKASLILAESAYSKAKSFIIKYLKLKDGICRAPDPGAPAHQPCRYFFTVLLHYFDLVRPHIGPQNLRHHNRPIRLLIILHHGDPRPSYRQP